MKKLILTLSAAALCSLSAMAQQTTGLPGKENTLAKTAGKNTATENRLISYANYVADTNGLTLRSEESFIYNGTRGFDAVLNRWKCDTSKGVSYYNGSIRSTGLVVTTFDAQDRIAERFIVSTQNAPGPVRTEWGRMIYTYDAVGHLISQEAQGIDSFGVKTTESKIIQTYDAQGRLIDWVCQYDNSGSLQNSSRSTYFYNANGKVDSSVYFLWSSSSASWEPSSRLINHYNGTAITSSSGERYTASGWQNFSSSTYAVDAKENIIEEVKKWWNGSTWENSSRFLYTYTVNNDITSSTFQWAIPQSNGYMNDELSTFSYNNYGQIEMETFQKWDPNTGSFDLMSKKVYRYESDDTATSVKTKQMQGSAVHLYPIPARNTLTVDMKWNETQPAAILLFDMTGKLAGQWTTPTAKQHTQTLDISNIPSGTYMLKVTGTKGVMSRQVNIVK